MTSFYGIKGAAFMSKTTRWICAEFVFRV